MINVCYITNKYVYYDKNGVNTVQNQVLIKKLKNVMKEIIKLVNTNINTEFIC